MEAIVAWPTALVLIILIFLLLFRSQIAALISRVQAIKGPKWDVALEQGQQGQQESPENNPSVEKLLVALGSSPPLVEREKLILEQLKAEGLSIDGPTVKVVVKYLAASQVLLFFEQTYLNIFGSQIQLLKLINERRSTGLKREHASVFIASRMQQAGLEASEQDFLHYLFLRNLIVEAEDALMITDAGVEFLSWMIRVGRSEDRPL
ncbi:hypothetical protein [Herbaspirillum rubrisubalbicans]|uniref:Uncharacterized protein n=1 Tax=Herbaspirillum rubrisubalbicans TaxID=80842 RepID=A0ABX9BU64_9BURK|nr:hypothetical protein [Herbaspirillum rubrisubalbicans]RAM61259.1 hypothetical protein RB24_26005 [Herbaspirillum rubrisubalbicans]